MEYARPANSNAASNLHADQWMITSTRNRILKYLLRWRNLRVMRRCATKKREISRTCLIHKSTLQSIFKQRISVSLQAYEANPISSIRRSPLMSDEVRCLQPRFCSSNTFPVYSSYVSNVIWAEKKCCYSISDQTMTSTIQ